MKQGITLTAIAMLPLMLLGQPVLNSSMNLSVNDTYKVNLYEDVTAIDPGPSGANVTWDYGTITGGTFIEGEPAICVDPASTPFADSSAAQAADIATKNDDGGIDGPYQYIEQSGTGAWLTGVGWYETGNTGLSTYSDKMQDLEYPLTFGDSFEDTYDMMMFNVSSGAYVFRDSGYIYVAADAYGTITTPKGTFTNALRLTRTMLSSTWMNMGGTWIFTGTTTIIEYFWYVPGIKVPVMVLMMMMEGFPDYSVHYLQEYDFVSTASSEAKENLLNIYPNPVLDKMTLRSDKQIDQIEVYDLKGSRCIQLPSDGQSLILTADLSLLPAGTYVMKVTFAEGTISSRRITKIR